MDKPKKITDVNYDKGSYSQGFQEGWNQCHYEMDTYLEHKEKEIERLRGYWKEFFSILDIVEESDSGRKFRPVYISSCRVLESKKIREIFDNVREQILKEK
ncbi:MAG: hypothetical protein ACTSXT_08185 [Candidatus Helarchaeota archaeon]